MSGMLIHAVFDLMDERLMNQSKTYHTITIQLPMVSGQNPLYDRTSFLRAVLIASVVLTYVSETVDETPGITLHLQQNRSLFWFLGENPMRDNLSCDDGKPKTHYYVIWHRQRQASWVQSEAICKSMGGELPQVLDRHRQALLEEVVLLNPFRGIYERNPCFTFTIMCGVFIGPRRRKVLSGLSYTSNAI